MACHLFERMYGKAAHASEANYTVQVDARLSLQASVIILLRLSLPVVLFWLACFIIFVRPLQGLWQKEALSFKKVFFARR
ncbi:hypothetical protein IPH25_03565 [bacterium]|nr:MAG: hypothetical protein IPG37_00555 [bacterium]QQR61534.1 MAG: hypothetical protein IPH25_03565 [bacterium]QQR62937.1 MAG: hypothetical protein IPH67_00415 [bacterium]